MSVPMFLGGVGQMMEIAANSTAPIISGIQTASPWAAEAATSILGSGGGSAIASGGAQAISPWAAYAGEGAASLLGSGGGGAAAAGGAAAEAGAAAGAGGAAAGGGGALAALGPVAAVVGSGLAGLAAGWGMSEGIDSQKSGFWGQDEWGNNMSMFDATAAIGRDTDSAVERGLGGGLIESVIGSGGVDTVGDIAGAGMTAATSVMAAPVGAAEAIYSFFAD